MRRILLLRLLAFASLLFGLSPVRAAEPLPDGLYAEFALARGSVVVRLLPDQTPLCVTSFVGLAEGTLAPRDGHPFFTGLNWYRVVPGFVIQSGNPGLADTGDTPIPYSFPDEFVPGLRHDALGVLSMANAGPDTNGCEFFLTLADTTRLNYLHSVFGRVVRGAELLPQIKADEPFSIKILRVGATAQAFRADRAAFVALVAKTKTYTSLASASAEPGPRAHFDDPDHVLPIDPPRAKNFNFKLANFERATGVKIYGRVFAKSPPGTPDQHPGRATAALARELGLTADGILAVYFADRDEWALWIGDRFVAPFVGQTGHAAELTKSDAFHAAKEAFFAAAKAQAKVYTAQAAQTATPENPVTPAKQIKFQVDAVLDALILKFEPKPAAAP